MLVRWIYKVHFLLYNYLGLSSTSIRENLQWMGANPQETGIDQYYQAILAIQARVIEGQCQVLARVAGQMAETVQRGGRLFVFGTGHSHMLAEEAFYRAGGLAAATPIFSALLMLHENPALGSRLERTAGLAKPLLDWYSPRPGEMLFIFSNSGVNRLPVEMAIDARSAGLFVVSISSHAYARVAPLSEHGKRLHEVVDLAIDNGLEPGDALVEIGEQGWRVGAGSTLIGSLIWNCLVTGCAARLAASGGALPVFASLNMAGAAGHNAALLEQWRLVNPHLPPGT
jgi:uncharacterized phosphosugar-binding protein